MPPNVSVNICEVKCIIFICSKYISHKIEIKVNSLTPDYVLNLTYPLVVLKFDSKEPKLF